MKEENYNMNLNLKELNQLQNTLDNHIMENHNLNRKQTTQPRILALLVELAESANETRCFKFWSLKPSSQLAIIEEELSDVLHFIISLNLNLETPLEFLTITEMDADLTDLFLIAFQQAIELKRELTAMTIAKMLNIFFNIVLKVGSSPQALLQAYLHKNQVNHQRQDQQY